MVDGEDQESTTPLCKSWPGQGGNIAMINGRVGDW